MVATVSNITSWLFWNSLTKGKTRAGRYSTSLNSGLQWLKAESVLEKEIYFIKEYSWYKLGHTVHDNDDIYLQMYSTRVNW